jgi:hypothetical protein
VHTSSVFFDALFITMKYASKGSDWASLFWAFPLDSQTLKKHYIERWHQTDDLKEWLVHFSKMKNVGFLIRHYSLINQNYSLENIWPSTYITMKILSWRLKSNIKSERNDQNGAEFSGALAESVYRN